MDNAKKKSKKVGAFWVPRNANGPAKLTGEIEFEVGKEKIKIKCSMFPNRDFREGGNKPKYILLAYEDQTPAQPKTPPATRRAAATVTRTPPTSSDPDIV